MQTMFRGLVVLGVLLGVLLDRGLAVTHYVVPPGTAGVAPAADYLTWDTAATNLGDAMAVAGSGSVVMVTNGLHYLTNVINVVTGIVIRSWRDGELDPTNTVVIGTGATNCFYLNHAGALLEGLTITNGYAQGTLRGGGVYIYENGGTVRRCIIAGNSAWSGAGVFMRSTKGLLENSTIRNNRGLGAGGQGGGGVYVELFGSVQGCDVYSNTTAGAGGGIYLNTSGTVYNTFIHDNSANYGAGLYLLSSGMARSNRIYNNRANYGGGISMDQGGRVPGAALIEHCWVTGNYGAGYGGGVHTWTATNFIIRNCLVADNTAAANAGGIGITSAAGTNRVIENCTIVGNRATNATSYGGGVVFSQNATATNCIVYYNTAANYPNCRILTGQNPTGRLDYSCSWPAADLISGEHNITNAPGFADTNNANYRLTVEAPCLHAGINLPGMEQAVDLDGQPRLDRVVRRADMGCYEFMPPGTFLRIR